jgi:hypothetical protein
MGCPRSPQSDIVLSVEEVAYYVSMGSYSTLRAKRTGIARVQAHGFKTFVFLQYSTGPFPHSTHVRLSAELVTLVGYRNWMPMTVRNVGAPEVDEEAPRIRTRLCTGVAVRQRP